MSDEVTDLDEIESLKVTLREHGLHATPARVAVLQILREAHEHRSVDEIRSRVLARYPAIDPVTVYRTLESLEVHGLAVKMELGDKVARWAHITHAHHHLICRRCKAIVELEHGPFERLADELAASVGVRVDLHHLVVHGLCAACAADRP